MHSPQLVRGFLPFLVVVMTLAFAWLVSPFAGAILWAVIVAVLFDPLNDRMLRAMPRRPGRAAAVTLMIIIAVVVVPMLLLGAAMVRELVSFYARLRSAEIDPGRIFVDLAGHLPGWARSGLAEIGLGDIAGVRARLSQWLASSLQPVVGQVLELGQGTFGFFLALGAMLYVTFFLLRDGHQLSQRVASAIPLMPGQRAILIEKCVSIIRATIKGSLIVAMLQGAIGGVTFWALGLPSALLWGVAMGFFSLFPAIGTGLIWVPVAIYLLVTGAVWQAVVLFACGFFIISSVDNVVRPMLVGRDARIPDYVILIATLGGFELMGFNGFVVGPVIAGLFMAVWEIFSDKAAGVEG